jgi:hypothetical protein
MMVRSAFALTLALSLLVGVACGGSDAGDATADSGITSRYSIDATNVPDDLRPLIPLAARWGIGDDVDRSEYIGLTTPDEREALKMAVAPLQARITAWLDSFGTNPMSDEAAAFMYMQLAVEELPD